MTEADDVVGGIVTATILRVIQRILFAMVALAALLVLFTAMQFNSQGAGLMAVLALTLYAAARTVGWMLAVFLGSDRI